MKLGTITSIVKDRGFGFIATPGSEDCFFHMGELVGMDFDDQLIERRVEFDMYVTERGPKARNVKAAE